MMLRSSVRFLVLVATAVSGSFAHAQLNRYPTMPMASAMLLGSQTVQKELKFSATQTKTIQDAFGAYADTAQRLVAAYKKDRAHKSKYNEPLKAAQKKLITTCLTSLSASQTKRLVEIGLQHHGIFSVTQPDIAKLLGLSGAQSTQAKKNYMTYWTTMDTVSKARAAQIRDVPQPKNVNDKKAVEAYKKKVQELARLSRDVDNKKVLAVQKDMETKTRALLSKAQLAKFEAMKGRPFKGT